MFFFETLLCNSCFLTNNKIDKIIDFYVHMLGNQSRSVESVWNVEPFFFMYIF